MLCSLNLGSIRSFLASLYHRTGSGRKPYDPVSMLKAQLIKHLWRVPSDRRLSLLLKRNKRVAWACGFRQKTPSHGLFTQFRHRLGKDFITRGIKRLVKLFRKRVSVERMFGRAKEWLLLDHGVAFVDGFEGFAGVPRAIVDALALLPCDYDHVAAGLSEGEEPAPKPLLPSMLLWMLTPTYICSPLTWYSFWMAYMALTRALFGP